MANNPDWNFIAVLVFIFSVVVVAFRGIGKSDKQTSDDLKAILDAHEHDVKLRAEQK
jgi:hypothetical protein